MRGDGANEHVREGNGAHASVPCLPSFDEYWHFEFVPRIKRRHKYGSIYYRKQIGKCTDYNRL